MFCLQESKEEFSDISQILIKIAQKHNRHGKGSKSDRVKNDNPTIGEVVSLSNEEMTSVWDRFKYGISKEEMFPDQAHIITEVVDSMRELPIVGKGTLT